MVKQNRTEIGGGFGGNKIRARHKALMSHAVVIRLKEMGLPEELDSELAALATDLGDLCSAQEDLAEGMEELLSTTNGWEGVADSLVDIRCVIDHMAWHLDGVRRPMNRITSHAYRKSEDTQIKD